MTSEATRSEEIDKVKSRLKEAERDYVQWIKQQEPKDQDPH